MDTIKIVLVIKKPKEFYLPGFTGAIAGHMDIEILAAAQSMIAECHYLVPHESYDWCDLSENPCIKDTGCDTWNEILTEEVSS